MTRRIPTRVALSYPAPGQPDLRSALAGQSHQETFLRVGTHCAQEVQVIVSSDDGIYRTRRHLFDHVYFRHVGRQVNDWKKSFPYPTISPAHHMRTLSIYSPEVITVAGTDTLLTFCSVSRLNVDSTRGYDQQVCLLPLHGFSPNIKSLYSLFANLPSSDIFGIIYSFPFSRTCHCLAAVPGENKSRWSLFRLHPSLPEPSSCV